MKHVSFIQNWKTGKSRKCHSPTFLGGNLNNTKTVKQISQKKGKNKTNLRHRDEIQMQNYFSVTTVIIIIIIIIPIIIIAIIIIVSR